MIKKIFFLLAVLPLLLFSQEFKIASWNLKNVSLNSLLFKKSISQINKYISSNSDFDVICLQELRDAQIIYFLSGGIKEILFSDFKRVTSKEKGRDTHKEIYGFLINKKHKNIKEVEFSNYKDFARPPMAVIIDDKIAIVNIHIIYGKKKAQRVKELKNLSKIVNSIENRYKIKKENIIIAGDFNLEKKDILKNLKNYQVLIDEKTTLGKKGLSKSYDHFIGIDLKGVAKVRTDLAEDFKFYTKNISDHLPIELITNIR